MFALLLLVDGEGREGKQKGGEREGEGESEGRGKVKGWRRRGMGMRDELGVEDMKVHM